MSLTKAAEFKTHGGMVYKYTHDSRTTNTKMTFNIFVPATATPTNPGLSLYFLAGLTCTEDNFMIKCGAQVHAAAHNVVLIAPDTSPRGAGIEGEDDSWDFGTGAGFYVNATADKWAKNYNMFDYVNKELQEIIEANFPVVAGLRSITGHSMGGHGALISAFKNPKQYVSVSAFAPICHPTQCPWGEKAFGNYMGSVEAGKDWDATELMLKNGPFPFKVMCDVGTVDPWSVGADVDQLRPDDLDAAMKEKGQEHVSRKHEGYEHGYYFVSTFIEDHIKFHAEQFCQQAVAKR